MINNNKKFLIMKKILVLILKTLIKYMSFILDKKIINKKIII